jgi:hypothetical protein
MLLGERLERFREMLLRQIGAGERPGSADIQQALANDWSELHQAVLKDPATYLAFAKAPGSEEVCEELLDLLATHPNLGRHRFMIRDPLPKPVFEGIADLLASGTGEQKVAAARLVRDLIECGQQEHLEVILEPCLGLLAAKAPRARAAALDVLVRTKPDRLEQSLPHVSDLWNSSDDREVRRSCLAALDRSRSAAGEQLFYEKMSETIGATPLDCFNLLQMRLARGNSADADRCGELLLSAVRGTPDPAAFQGVVHTALELPLAKAMPVLEQAAASAPTPEARDDMSRLLGEIRKGEVRSDRLHALLRGPR